MRKRIVAFALVTLLVTVFHADAANIKDGLIGYWSFDNGPQDESGLNRGGIISGGVYSETGQSGFDKCYRFDGTGKIAAKEPSAATGSASITISVWIKPTTVVGKMAILRRRGDFADHYITIENGKFHFELSRVGTPPYGSPFDSVGNYTPDVWQHLAMVWDATEGQVRVYINGVLDSSYAKTGDIDWTHFSEFCIGNKQDDSTRVNFTGQMDDLALFSRALSATEISVLASGPLDRIKPDLIVESLKHSPPNPTTSDIVTITAVVKNLGPGAASASMLRMACGEESSPPMYNVPALAAGTNYTVIRQLRYDIAQNYRNTATADASNAVSETDESNNQLTDDFTVTDLARNAEMSVVGNGLLILSKSATANPTDGTDFGSTLITGGVVTRDFIIRNTGVSNLNLTGMAKVGITGINPTEFVVIAQPLSPVLSGSNVSFRIRFDPQAIGVRRAVVSIANNDAIRNPYTFAIQGTVVVVTAPSTVTANGIDFTNKIIISWLAVPGARYYRAYYSLTYDGKRTALGSWGTGISVLHLNAKPGQTYWYWVRAATDNKGANASAESVPDSSWMALSAPSPTASKGTYPDRVRVTWRTTTGATYYRLYCSTSAEGAKTRVCDWTSKTACDDLIVSSGARKWYSVQAAISATGDRASAFGPVDIGWCRLPAPTGVMASQGTYSDKVAVSWPAVPGAAFYQVAYAKSLNGTKIVLRNWAPALTADHTSASHGMTYYYFVRVASDATGADAGAYSTPVSGWLAVSVDLRVTGLTLNPSSPEPGKTFSATVTVKNDSATESTSGSTLAIWRDHPAPVAVGEAGERSQAVGTLGPLQSKTLTFNNLTAPATAGDYTFRAFVDSQNAVAEADEVNNQSTQSYTVAANSAGFEGYWLMHYHVSGGPVRIGISHFAQTGSSIIANFNPSVEGTVTGQSFDIALGSDYLQGDRNQDGTISGNYKFTKTEGVEQGSWIGVRILVADGALAGQGKLGSHVVNRNWTPAFSYAGPLNDGWMGSLGVALQVTSMSQNDSRVTLDFTEPSDISVGMHETRNMAGTINLNTWRENSTTFADGYDCYVVGGDSDTTGGWYNVERFDTRFVATYNFTFENGDTLSGSFDVPYLGE